MPRVVGGEFAYFSRFSGIHSQGTVQPVRPLRRQHEAQIPRHPELARPGSGVEVHQLGFQAIQMRFGGQSIGRKATETLIYPPLAGEFPTMNAGQPRWEHQGLRRGKSAARSAAPESTPGKTSPQPTAAITHIYCKPRLYPSQPTQAVDQVSRQ